MTYVVEWQNVSVWYICGVNVQLWKYTSFVSSIVRLIC